MSSSQLGSLIRMRLLSIQTLPLHPDFGDIQSGSPSISTFVSSALKEGHDFITNYLPGHFKVKAGSKPSPPSRAGVKLYAHDITSAELPVEAPTSGASSETWFARVSVHENEAKDGTASWEEFDNGLRVDHSQHEKDYTPGVYDAHEVLNWDTSLEQLGREVDEWQDVHVSVMEMAHTIPAPLNNRVFTVLVITAKREKELLVVQIPVSTKGLKGVKYDANADKVVQGMYCSIERGELIEDGKKVQWSMATASDAKGALPMWMQKMGVPGAVVKDVGFFIKWCAERRKGKE